jgi:hypothetical protein
VKQKTSSKEMSVLSSSVFPLLLNYRLRCLEMLKYMMRTFFYICVTNKPILCVKLYIFSSTYKMVVLRIV